MTTYTETRSSYDPATCQGRRDQCQELARQLTEPSHGHDVAATICNARELAQDAHWEVRHDVAFYLIALLPEAELPWFEARLTSDTNAYVARAAQRMLKQRRRLKREESQRRERHSRVARRIREVESRSKPPTAKQMARLCRQHGEELMAHVAHDLRTLAALLKPACSELSQAVDKSHAQAVATVREQLAMFDRLAQDMQWYSEPLQVEKRIERLREVVADAVQASRTCVEKLGIDASAIRIQVDMNEGIQAIVAVHLLRIALTNVITNALESFDGEWRGCRQAEIRIQVALGDSLVISVRDNGPGMSAEHLDSVAAFLPGRRNPLKRFSTGFGLAIAARNIAVHDGTMQIASHKGLGTEVTITLPVLGIEEVQP